MFKQAPLRITEAGSRWKAALLSSRSPQVLCCLAPWRKPQGQEVVKNLVPIPFELQAAFRGVVYAQLLLYLVLQGLHSWLEERTEVTT